MMVKMLTDVMPCEYDIEGQILWAETIQWEHGKVYDLSPDMADMFVVNKDAEYMEEENGTD